MTGYFLHFQFSKNPNSNFPTLKTYPKIIFDICAINLLISIIFFATDILFKRIRAKIFKTDKECKVFSYMFENSKIPMTLIDLKGNIIIGNTPFRNVLKSVQKPIQKGIYSKDCLSIYDLLDPASEIIIESIIKYVMDHSYMDYAHN